MRSSVVQNECVADYSNSWAPLWRHSPIIILIGHQQVEVQARSREAATTSSLRQQECSSNLWKTVIWNALVLRLGFSKQCPVKNWSGEQMTICYYNYYYYTYGCLTCSLPYAQRWPLKYYASYTLAIFILPPLANPPPFQWSDRQENTLLDKECAAASIGEHLVQLKTKIPINPLLCQRSYSFIYLFYCTAGGCEQQRRPSLCRPGFQAAGALWGSYFGSLKLIWHLLAKTASFWK